MGNVYHIPAMLPETIEGLHIHPAGTYVDVTFGGGGHSRAIMGELGQTGRLFSFDQDNEYIYWKYRGTSRRKRAHFRSCCLSKDFKRGGKQTHRYAP